MYAALDYGYNNTRSQLYGSFAKIIRTVSLETNTFQVPKFQDIQTAGKFLYKSDTPSFAGVLEETEM